MTINKPTDFLTGKRHIHMIGIGGSGMFPLAEIMHKRGFYITGSDNNETATLEAVRKLGIPVFMGQSSENVASAPHGGPDLVIYSAAIAADNAELVAARQLERDGHCLTAERSVLLGLLTSGFDETLCVSGTHGKTTVTGMLVNILQESESARNYGVSAVIGGKMRIADGRLASGLLYDGCTKPKTRDGQGVMVCEACEFSNTFLQLYPTVSVILNIDDDHMDFFKTHENLVNSFTEFARRTTKLLVVNGDDSAALESVRDLDTARVTFGYGDCDYRPVNIAHRDKFDTSFDIISGDGDPSRAGKILVPSVVLRVAGDHNILNAVAAAAAALNVGVTAEEIVRGLDKFYGVGRRFERRGTCEGTGADIYDDYAHHPAEISATLDAALSLGYKRIVVIHQPFTFSRTHTLMDDFAAALSKAGLVLLTDIMGGREVNTCGVTSEQLCEKVRAAGTDCRVCGSLENTAAQARLLIGEGDFVITMGCGDIYKAADILVKMQAIF